MPHLDLHWLCLHLKDNAVNGHMYIGGSVYKGINLTAIINDPEYKKVNILKQAFSNASIKIKYKEYSALLKFRQ